jgi:hypothetical protein
LALFSLLSLLLQYPDSSQQEEFFFRRVFNVLSVADGISKAQAVRLLDLFLAAAPSSTGTG